MSLLSTVHRALITLSALHLGQGPRKVVLAKNQVTEDDLCEYYEQWKRLQVVHRAQQARYEHVPAGTRCKEAELPTGVVALPPLTTKF